MKYVDEYRDAHIVARVCAQIAETVTKPWVLMEVCGGQTHSILRYGLDQLLPPELTLVHGPGCPVCVTPISIIDRALALAVQDDVILASYGDMLRVPGSAVGKDRDGQIRDLFEAKGRGGDVRVVYSPLDAVQIACENPNKTVVFLGIGFETTAPANGMALLDAARKNLGNFCMLASHVTVPAAICAIMDDEACIVDGFLAAGHVCTVMGMGEYEPLCRNYKIPIVVTGFEPVDILQGVLETVRLLEAGEFQVLNAYKRTVRDSGNTRAQMVIDTVFEVCDREWRGLGMIPKSGYRIRSAYSQYDAEKRFPELCAVDGQYIDVCCSGKVLKGLLKPDECPAFGKTCTPTNPLGAPMVSGEGACSAYFKYGRGIRNGLVVSATRKGL